MKYIIKFLQSRDNNNKQKFGFHNFAEQLQKARGTPVPRKNQCNTETKAPECSPECYTGDTFSYPMRVNFNSSISEKLPGDLWNTSSPRDTLPLMYVNFSATLPTAASRTSDSSDSSSTKERFKHDLKRAALWSHLDYEILAEKTAFEARLRKDDSSSHRRRTMSPGAPFFHPLPPPPFFPSRGKIQPS